MRGVHSAYALRNRNIDVALQPTSPLASMHATTMGRASTSNNRTKTPVRRWPGGLYLRPNDCQWTIVTLTANEPRRRTSRSSTGLPRPRAKTRSRTRSGSASCSLCTEPTSRCNRVKVGHDRLGGRVCLPRGVSKTVLEEYPCSR